MNRSIVTTFLAVVILTLTFLLLTNVRLADRGEVMETWTVEQDVMNIEGHPRRLYNQDKKLQLLRDNSVTTNLTDLDLPSMSDLQIQLTLHSALDNTEVVCNRKLRMGNIGDGGWEICDDPPVRPSPGPHCIVYSFGINYDFSFDDHVAQIYGCHVYSFDPSMTDETHNRSRLVHFYKLGISNTSSTDRQGWKLRTLTDLRAMLGHTDSVIDVLKIDVEYAEWLALPEMIRSGALKGVRQLLVEYHTLPPSDSWYQKVHKPTVKVSDAEASRQRLTLLKAIHSQGFRVFYPHKNEHCLLKVKEFPSKRSSCYEVHYIQTK